MYIPAAQMGEYDSVKPPPQKRMSSKQMMAGVERQSSSGRFSGVERTASRGRLEMTAGGGGSLARTSSSGGLRMERQDSRGGMTPTRQSSQRQLVR